MASTGCQVCQCLRGAGQVKDMYLQMFREGSNWYGWRVRQQQVVPESRGTRMKSSCAFAGLDPRDWQTKLYIWYQWMEWEWWGKHGVKINRLLFMKRFAGPQTDLEQYSQIDWQPMKGMTQWNTVSERRWLCNDTGESILSTFSSSSTMISSSRQSP